MALVVALPTSAGLAQPDTHTHTHTHTHTLSLAEYNFIETYDRENEAYYFASDFAYMAHTVDFNADGCSESCFSRSRKRTLNIEISMVPTENLKLDVFLNAIAQVRLFIDHTTELSTSVRPLLDPTVSDGGALVFIAVDESNQKNFWRPYETAHC